VTRHSESLTRFLPLCLAVALAAGVFGSAAGAASGPVLTKRPTVNGAATQGTRLVVSRGTWTGATKYVFRWFRCDTMGRHCRLLHGVTGRGHRAGANDVGHTLSAAVRATGPSGSTLAFASLVGPIAGTKPSLDSLTQPIVAGKALQGSTLHVGTGRWRPKPSSFDYQWARCNAQLRACAAIGGETHPTHAIGADDLGHVLVAIVQARSGATSRAVFSRATAVVVASDTNAAGATKPSATKPSATKPSGGTGPSLGSAPAIAVVLQQGHQLAGSIGAWSGSGTISYAYNWYRCDSTGAHCLSVHGATKPTYTLGAKDVGHTLGFAVHAKDSSGTADGYAPLVGPIAPVGAALVSTGAPTVTGTSTFQVSSGSWSQAPTALSYQWLRCNANGRLCAQIAGATNPGYAATADDAGHRLVALVHATAGAASQDVLSDATAVVGAAAAGPSLTTAPSVGGTAAQGSQLTGNPGTWSSSATISYTYNWYRCDAAGAHCLSIHGATKPTYTLGAKDAGHTLGFAVHATDANGTVSGYASLVGPIAAAGAALASTASPAISGAGTFQVSNGSWNQTPTAFAYSWSRCNANGRLCTPIDGATAAAYTATSADVGHTLIATVTATFNGAQQAALSLHTAVIG
jgi:hypothetical protein